MAKGLQIKDVLIYAGIAYLASKYLANYAYDNFILQKTRLKFGQMNLNGINGKVFLTVENKTAIPVHIQSVVGELLYSGNKIADFSELSGFTIAEKTTSEIDINFFIPYNTLSSSLSNIIASKQFLTYATIKGVARSANINIPFDMPVSPF